MGPGDDPEPARRGVVRIYVDSTEVQHPNPAMAKLGRITDPKLHAALHAAGLQVCVPELVIDEVAHRRLRRLKKVHGQLLKLARETQSYIPATIPDSLNDEDLLKTFRAEANEQLKALDVMIVPTATVSLPDVLGLSLRRERPFAGTGEDERDPTGFHDAVILLASLRDAQKTGVGQCYFVSADNDHSDEAINRLAEQYGVTCTRFKSISDLAETLETIAEDKTIERPDVVIAMATTYMNEHIGVIQAKLDEAKPIVVGDLPGHETGTFRQITKITIDPASVRAAPQGVRRDGMDRAPLGFRFHAVVGVLATEIPPPLSVEQTPIQPGLELSGVNINLRSIENFRLAEKVITVPMKGRATAPRFDGTRYEGTPIIESLEVYRPLTEALGAPLNPYAT